MNIEKVLKSVLKFSLAFCFTVMVWMVKLKCFVIKINLELYLGSWNKKSELGKQVVAFQVYVDQL